VKKEIVVNRTSEETKVAVFEDGMLFDLFIERRESGKILNNIYKGKVQNIVPALDSVFLDIGFGKSAYLGATDIIGSDSKMNIEDKIKEGQEIMVQVYKEPISTKGPKVTMDISLPGRLLVYMPFQDTVGVSKNIQNKTEYQRLKTLVTELKEGISGGIIVRTEAENTEKEEIAYEIKHLTRLWNSIVAKFNSISGTHHIHKDLGIVFQTIRDYLSDEVSIVHIDSKKEFDDVCEFVKIIAPELLEKIVLYDSSIPIFKAYGIYEETKKLHSNKANLPSGGYLIIQEAESLCAIDVNSGKFTKRNNQEDTASITNVEAAKEVARQLRLRNIGGIIVIDFIDMRKSVNKQKILETLRQATKGDKAKIKIWPITKLGLIEMSRQRKKESLFSLLGDNCPLCKGLGRVLSKESIFINVCDEIEKLLTEKYLGTIKVKVNHEVVDYFTERKDRLIKLFNTNFDIKASNEILRDDYQVIFE
jgi:ribonuclease G